MPEKRDSHPLGPFIRRFLVEDVIVDRNLTRNTQISYRDTIRLLLRFMVDQHSTEPTTVTVEQITEPVVRAFLEHLRKDRGASVATQNQRLGALHSLFRFIARQAPDLVEHAAQIRSIAFRRTTLPPMPYLERSEIDALLAVPNRERAQGQRDYALLLFLYNTGARASEAAHLTVGDLSLGSGPSVRFLGKGRKIRHCPLWSDTTSVLRELLGSRLEGSSVERVFLNVRGQPITRFGVHCLLERTVAKASETTPSLRGKRVSPHSVRHSTSTHLLRAGVDINTIRAWLGHVSIDTTNRYTEIDLEVKAKALEMCAIASKDRTPIWRKDTDLMTFLTTVTRL